MYNIISLKHGTKYSSTYVNRLFYGVRRNTTLPIKFHCFTEDPTGLDPKIVTHPLPHKNVEGWWQKLYLLSGEIDVEGRVLYMDLDTLIVGNIDHFLQQEQGFVCLRDFWSRGKNDMASAIMSYEVGQLQHVWDTFIADPKAAIASLRPHGDQRWIQKQQQERLYWQVLYPNQVVSFKTHCRRGIPHDARIICYHGKPSIVESINQTTRVQGFVIPPTPWVKEHWKDE